MSARRQLALWIVLAVVGVAAFTVAARRQYQETRRRGATTVAPRPAEGNAVFRAKGCTQCHTANVLGARVSAEQPTAEPLPVLVTAMWNHAPRMWDAMSTQHIKYPDLSYEEAGQLVAYLYLSRSMDEPGDQQRGAKLFEVRQCKRCHEVAGGSAPTVAQLASTDDLVVWTQRLWNHASAMQERMQQVGITWPRFESNDLRDLFSYVRQDSRDSHRSIATADPDRGWRVFQEKGCIECHGISRGSEHVAADFGPGRDLPPTYSQFAASMLNHFPTMQRAIATKGGRPPVFGEGEMADLTVFLYNLHYLEPSGSPQVGASVFGWRGCAQCHGKTAEGARGGPALRGRGQTYTSVRLAAALWGHGARMYAETRAQGQPWPSLLPSDVGDLLAFLNTPVEKK